MQMEESSALNLVVMMQMEEGWREKFYIYIYKVHDSMHHESILIKVRDANYAVFFILLQNHSTCFR